LLIFRELSFVYNTTNESLVADSHDTIWMEVNDKQGTTAVLSVDMVRLPFHPVRPKDVN
jgi:hypothetical protein